MDHKQVFSDFLESVRPGQGTTMMAEFERYLALLQEINLSINLISRQMPVQSYWTHHFLDSILPLECLDIRGKRVLDFGSGGGLPGIPLKIAEPSLQMDLLDSTSKKVRSLQQMVTALGLTKTGCLTCRLEDYALRTPRPVYDLIVCRAVSLEQRYLEPLYRLLHPQGSLLLYKSHNIADIQDLNRELLLEYKNENIGLRRIFRIERTALVKK